MKKILNLIGAALAALFLGSCTTDRSGGDAPAQRALLTVRVLTHGAGEHDYVHTARFIVFDDVSGFPSVDVNEFIALGENDLDAAVFETTLKVSCNRDKMVAVVLNEPGEATTALGSVSSPADLGDVTFLMADALNANHTAPVPAGLPMAGLCRNVVVTVENAAEASAATANVTVERSVARVELWLKTDEDTSGEVTAATSVALTRSHGSGYLVGPDPGFGFGNMMTVADPAGEVVWTYEGDDPIALDETERFVCAFYTPERTCSAAADADKLSLHIRNVNFSGGLRSASTVLAEFAPEGGQMEEIAEIRRNNIYKVVGRLRTMGFDHIVLPWTEANVGVIIDPQYYLDLTDSDILLSALGDSRTIVAETDYDRSDRGFPAGLQLNPVIKYYDSQDNPVSSGAAYGWITLTRVGDDGDMSMSITLTVNNALTAQNRGSRAVVEVSAGNLIKRINVIRYAP